MIPLGLGRKYFAGAASVLIMGTVSSAGTYGLDPEKSMPLLSFSSGLEGPGIPVSAILAALASLGLFIAGFTIFVSRKTGIKVLKVKERLFLGMLTMTGSLVIPQWVGILLIGGGKAELNIDFLFLTFGVPIFGALLFIAATASSVSSGFREHLRKLKEKYLGAQER
jgi:hypothetical protein